MSYGSEWDGFLNWDYGNAIGRDQFPSVPLSDDEQVIKAAFIPSGATFYPATITQPVQVIQAINASFSPTIYLLTITQTTTATIICLPWSVETQIYPPVITQPVQTIALNLISSTAIVFNPTIIAPSTDTSDILDRGRYRQKRAEEIYEENIAAQILKKRRYDEEQKRKKKKKKLMPKEKFEMLVRQVAPEFRSTKQKRIKALLLLATMDD